MTNQNLQCETIWNFYLVKSWLYYFSSQRISMSSPSHFTDFRVSHHRPMLLFPTRPEKLLRPELLKTQLRLSNEFPQFGTLGVINLFPCLPCCPWCRKDWTAVIHSCQMWRWLWQQSTPNVTQRHSPNNQFLFLVNILHFLKKWVCYWEIRSHHLPFNLFVERWDIPQIF